MRVLQYQQGLGDAMLCYFLDSAAWSEQRAVRVSSWAGYGHRGKYRLIVIGGRAMAGGFEMGQEVTGSDFSLFGL